MIEDRAGRLERRLGDDADEVVDAQQLVDRLVEELRPVCRDPLAAGVRIADQAVAGGDHVDGVVGQGGQRVRDRRDHADHPPRPALVQRDAVVAAEAVGRQARRPRGQARDELELLPLVRQVTDARLLVLHPSQGLGLLGDDRANGLAGLLALHQRPPRERPLGGLGGGDGLVDVGELAEAAARAAAEAVAVIGAARPCRASGPHDCPNRTERAGAPARPSGG